MSLSGGGLARGRGRQRVSQMREPGRSVKVAGAVAPLIESCYCHTVPDAHKLKLEHLADLNVHEGVFIFRHARNGVAFEPSSPSRDMRPHQILSEEVSP
jgi:hypothetical protein